MKQRRKSVRNKSVHSNLIEIPTVIEFILDETGSMNSCKQTTIAGFNEFLDEQRSVNGTCLLTLTKFDTSGLKTPYVDIDVNFVPYMSSDMFNPGSSTNLQDAIGYRIDALETRLNNNGWVETPRILVVIMTDGQDNASSIYSQSHIRDLIKTKSIKGWTFVYLGANHNALTVAEQYGIAHGNAKTFSHATMKETMYDLAKATTAYRAGKQDDNGTTTSTEFFKKQASN